VLRVDEQREPCQRQGGSASQGDEGDLADLGVGIGVALKDEPDRQVD
jgi:hypothetical protein